MSKPKRQDPLKSGYSRLLKLGLIISISAHIIGFQAMRFLSFSFERYESPAFDQIKLEKVVALKKLKVAPRPALPQVPVPALQEELPENETIEPVKLDLARIPETPPPPFADTSSAANPDIFIPYEEPPEPVGGLAAIQANLEYPLSALRGRFGGTVLLKVRISAEGQVTDVDIARSFGYKPCERAAIKAVTSVLWKPAMLRHKPVSVWVGIPVVFAR